MILHKRKKNETQIIICWVVVTLERCFCLNNTGNFITSTIETDRYALRFYIREWFISIKYSLISDFRVFCSAMISNANFANVLKSVPRCLQSFLFMMVFSTDLKTIKMDCIWYNDGVSCISLLIPQHYLTANMCFYRKVKNLSIIKHVYYKYFFTVLNVKILYLKKITLQYNLFPEKYIKNAVWRYKNNVWICKD